jgi:putative transcriptional regulator
MEKKLSRLTEAILETANDMHEAGILDETAYEKITMRHINEEKPSILAPITSGEIRQLRKQAHVSQAVFACYLNLTTGYISQLERGLKKPSGPTLVLLNVIRRKGFESILY